jgi:hypothetical protein
MYLYSDNDWDYHGFPLDEPAETFGALAPVVAAWRDKRDGDALPAWRNFTLRDFTPQWPFASAYDVLDEDASMFRVRFWGTQTARLHRGDWTGLTLSAEIADDGNPHLVTTTADLRFYKTLCLERRIGLMRGPIEVGNDYQGFADEVVVPLSNGGGRVDMLLFVYHEHMNRREFLDGL